MRELEPIERLLVDLVDDNDDKEEILYSEEAIPQANTDALVCLVRGLLDEEEASAVFEHYHIDDGNMKEINPITAEQVYLTAMSKLRNSDRPKDWYYFIYPIECLWMNLKRDEKEIEEEKRIIAEKEEQLESAKFIWEFLALFHKKYR